MREPISFWENSERERDEVPRENLERLADLQRENEDRYAVPEEGVVPLPPPGLLGASRRRAINIAAILDASTTASFLTSETYLAAVIVGLAFAESERQIAELELVELIHHRGSCGEVGPFQIMPVYLYDATETAIGKHFDLRSCWDVVPETPEEARSLDVYDRWYSEKFSITKQAIAVVSYLDRWGTPLRRSIGSQEGLRWRLWMWAGLHHRGPSPDMENFPASYLSRYQSGIDLANRAIGEMIADDRKCRERI